MVVKISLQSATTALHVCAEKNAIEIAETLLENGADPNRIVVSLMSVTVILNSTLSLLSHVTIQLRLYSIISPSGIVMDKGACKVNLYC